MDDSPNCVYNSYDILLTDHRGCKTFNRHLLHYIWSQDDKVDRFLTKLDEISHIDNLVDTFGCTLLHYAVEYNNVSISAILIKLGCSIHAVDNSGRTPFLLGLAKKDESMISLLVRYVTEVYVDEGVGRSWLHTILSEEKLSRYVPRLLLQKVKVRSGDDMELANILIAEKCELCYAIHTRKCAVIKIMIDHGFAIDAQDVKGHTALHFAVRFGQTEMVKLLLECGADVNARNTIGQIPINYPNIFYATAEQQDILKLLLEHRCQWSLLDETYRMQIYNLMCYGPKEAIEILLNLNADYAARDAFHQTILHYIVKNRNTDVVQLLKSRDIDPNVEDDKGRTPLHIAAKEKNEIACKIFLDKGADVNKVSDTFIAVPLFYAITGADQYNNCKKCIELLLDHGADAQFSDNGYTVFNVPQSRNFARLSVLLIGHFVLLEAFGKELTEVIQEEIFLNCFYEMQFSFCKQRLIKTQQETIYKEITLYDFLIESEDKITSYMYNNEILSKIQSYNSDYHCNAYINHRFQMRINNAIELANLRKQATIALENLTASTIRYNDIIVREVISYLNREDLQSLANLVADNIA
ncbi:ankyrin-1-like [Phymastichus coffea]|uniref:ankyrin-1-like n=1 Tax=Phymastichus coffea TaxID=108790 RepID=UPI00273B344A|nr:ankyrin-1-like [Phymastichus coffea]